MAVGGLPMLLVSRGELHDLSVPLLLIYDPSNHVSFCLSPAMPTFSLAAHAILRLSLLPGATLPHISKLLAAAVDVLKRLENGVDYPETWMVVCKDGEDTADAPPYTSRGLHQPPAYEHPFRAWGISVEALWRVAMGLERKAPAWDVLTCRMLLWRSVVGPEASPMGEWVRREVMTNMMDVKG